jgi:hypothetical protein
LLQSELAAKMILLGEQMLEPVSDYVARSGGAAKGASPKIVLQAARETFTLAFLIRRFKRHLRSPQSRSGTTS